MTHVLVMFALPVCIFSNLLFFAEYWKESNVSVLYNWFQNPRISLNKQWRTWRQFTNGASLALKYTGLVDALRAYGGEEGSHRKPSSRFTRLTNCFRPNAYFVLISSISWSFEFSSFSRKVILPLKKVQ